MTINGRFRIYCFSLFSNGEPSGVNLLKPLPYSGGGSRVKTLFFYKPTPFQIGNYFPYAVFYGFAIGINGYLRDFRFFVGG